jgi:hypothetical protein
MIGSPALDAGTLMTVGGSIIVAAIGAYAMIRARRVEPGREPVPLRDIWAENRSAREEADRERAENVALERMVTNQGTAIVVMWTYIGRLIDSWGTPTMPRLTRNEQAVIDRVIDDITTAESGIPGLSPDPEGTT